MVLLVRLADLGCVVPLLIDLGAHVLVTAPCKPDLRRDLLVVNHAELVRPHLLGELCVSVGAVPHGSIVDHFC